MLNTVDPPQLDLPPDRHNPDLPPIATTGWLEWDYSHGALYSTEEPETVYPELAEQEWRHRHGCWLKEIQEQEKLSKKKNVRRCAASAIHRLKGLLVGDGTSGKKH